MRICSEVAASLWTVGDYCVFVDHVEHQNGAEPSASRRYKIASAGQWFSSLKSHDQVVLACIPFRSSSTMSYCPFARHV